MAETLFAISYKVVFLIDEEVGDGGDSDVAERWGLVDRWKCTGESAILGENCAKERVFGE